ncbi:ABC transporter permease [Candidatus Peregrinibacteria bacterium]|nr:ABC transporter permease [Candidatus Peregrinibacteria bacterium]
MLFSDTLSIARRGIGANFLRSLLTMLGIIIGVGSVVLMTSIGASVEQLILSQVSTLGARSMIVIPGREHGPPVSDSLTLNDAEELKRLSTVETVAPVIMLTGTVRYGREERSPETLGITADFFQNQSISAAHGRLLDRLDENGARFVAVIGPDTAEDLFGNEDPLGRRIQVLDHSFTVVGVLEPVGTQFFQSIDDRVYIPLAVAEILTGRRHANFVTLQATENTDLAKLDIETLLRQRHRIDNPGDEPDKNDDFVVRSAQQATDILGTVSLALTALLTAIAAISLVVGGVGIMNIMLVAVTERTREIGLRKAVGARKRDILLQFLIEAVLLTTAGGVIGVVGGLLTAAIGAVIASRFLAAYQFAFSVPAILLALAVAVGVGLLFGLYPAKKASELSPMEALRYE